jgi:hypothetical protein
MRLKNMIERFTKYKDIPLHMIVSILIRKLFKAIRNIIIKFNVTFRNGPYSKPLKRLLKIKESQEEYLNNKFSHYFKFILNESDKAEIVNLLNTHFIEWTKRTKEKAESICNHSFSILGVKQDLGEEINWHKDYLSGHKWPVKYHKEIKIINYNDDSDVKFPWELSRFHQGVYLGKAYALTKNEKYAKEFFSEVKHWIEENPPYLGVNWTCAMEVAIRAVNIIWSIFFFKDSRYFDNTTKELFIKSLHCHGKYIHDNLEINLRFIDGRYREVNGNHYVANLVGLLYISFVFPEFKESIKWFSRAYNGLINEVRLQIGEDGVHYEYCLNYQRIVLELLLSALIILMKMNIEVPKDVLKKVEKMVEFIKYYIKPNGEIPLIRDIDNGRLHILGDESLIDHKHLLSIGAILFEKRELTNEGFSEDALWLFGVDGYKKFKALETKRKEIYSREFDKSGFYILRKGAMYMFVVASAVGMHGFCGHTHNDFLSFDLYAYDKSFLTDSGSYVYGRYPKWRNNFRSTYNHNTVVINGHEINEINEKDIFSIGNEVKPKINSWYSDNKMDLLDAEYILTFENADQVCHQRKFFFEKEKNFWIVKDLIYGKGLKKVETFFHFDKNIDLLLEDEICIRSVCKQGANIIIIPISDNNNTLQLIEGWVSSIYGSLNKRQVAKYSYNGYLPFEISYVLFPVPHYENESQENALERSYNDYLTVSTQIEKLTEVF